MHYPGLEAEFLVKILPSEQLKHSNSPFPEHVAQFSLHS